MRYRAKCKPTQIVDAFQYDGDLKRSNGQYSVPIWAVEAFENGILYYYCLTHGGPHCELFVKVPGGSLHIEVGNYVIRSRLCQMLVCNDHEFNEYFEEVTQ